MAQERYKVEALGQVEDFNTFVVDGNAVRQALDPDFDGGSFVDHEYIPPGELWVDDQACGLGDVAEIEQELTRQAARARQQIAIMSDEELADALSKDYEPLV